MPSVNAAANTNTPISTVRGSVHALSGFRRSPSSAGAWPSGRKARTATGPATATIAATATRWTAAETASATIAVPTSAPATVPMLNPAWKRGMIARPSSRSTAEPSTFMATSQVPLPTPSANSPTTTGATPTR